ncbi:MAG: RdgB/HAM1 family non-canonical purine NTP pyrophosphatase [Chitinophagaceae bacterium]|jgi:XTP/dITP diphosphohydrolase|nr:RdgB/HAM1 family non-canonical purine NTP pyrophosphatase [Chitinophagaceae bacterium]
MKLIFATNNQFKVKEIQPEVGNFFELVTLKEAGINTDIPEPFNTLEENATHKSKTISELTGLDCFSEDTGLEVYSLNGEPGVKSARYSGEEKSFEKNIDKLLEKLKSKPERKARFRTVISLMLNGTEKQFEGICEGEIIEIMKGDRGFGYDPVFVPFGSDKTFAQMTINEKNEYSHRKKAVNKLVNYLHKIKQHN